VSAVRVRRSRAPRGGLARETAPAPNAVVRDVAADLLALGPAWRVRHGVRPGFRAPAVEHTVIGPAGIFAVVTLRHDDATVWVRGENLLLGGHWAGQLTDARRAARAMAGVLSGSLEQTVSVLPVVALIGDPARCMVGRRPHGAHIAVSGSLAAWLRTRPAQLSPEQVDAIDRYVRDPVTWDARRAG
jgi:hypothetical protein